jgi:hypothetical protein
MNKLLKEYLQNEENNCHAENCVLLAENFGTESEKFICYANLNYKNRFFNVDCCLSSAAHQATKQYVKKLVDNSPQNN